MGASLAAGSTHAPQRDVDATLGLARCAGGEPLSGGTGEDGYTTA
jgi:hypothetical protein